MLASAEPIPRSIIQGASVGKIAGVPHTWPLRVGSWVAFVAAVFRSGRFGVHRLAAAFSISTTSTDCSSSIGESDTPTCHSRTESAREESLFSCFFTGCPTRRCCVWVVSLSAVALQLLRTPRRSAAPHNTAVDQLNQAVISPSRHQGGDLPSSSLRSLHRHMVFLLALSPFAPTAISRFLVLLP
jgi:hypothetical protein